MDIATISRCGFKHKETLMTSETRRKQIKNLQEQNRVMLGQIDVWVDMVTSNCQEITNIILDEEEDDLALRMIGSHVMNHHYLNMAM
jgi:hypothetical protein